MKLSAPKQSRNSRVGVPIGGDAGRRRVKYLDENLQQFLSEFARLLVPAGVTPKQFEELSTYAFVRAACEFSKFRNGAVNRSRVAVLTALRRAEVQRHLLVSRNAGLISSAHRPRTESVIAGWTSDKRYSRSGLPLRLPISGRNNSFIALAKEFAGDVPHRAVLEELRRLRVVREQNQCVELRVGRARSSVAALQTLRDLFPILLDGVKAARKNKSGAQEPSLQRLTLVASDLVDLSVLRERVTSGASSYLDGLKRSLKRPTVSARKRKMKHGLTVTLLVREYSSFDEKESNR